MIFCACALLFLCFSPTVTYVVCTCSRVLSWVPNTGFLSPSFDLVNPSPSLRCQPICLLFVWVVLILGLIFSGSILSTFSIFFLHVTHYIIIYTYTHTHTHTYIYVTHLHICKYMHSFIIYNVLKYVTHL